MKNPILVKGSPASGKSMRLQEILSSIKNTASVVAYGDANFMLENTDNLAHACIAVVEVANANQLERLLEIAQTSDCQLVIIFQTSPVVNLSQDLLAKTDFWRSAWDGEANAIQESQVITLKKNHFLDKHLPTLKKNHFLDKDLLKIVEKWNIRLL